MPHREDLGFQSLPENGLKIVRSRTLLGNMRLWEIPRSEQALETVVEEIGRSPIPGLYVLLDERAEKRAYIGNYLPAVIARRQEPPKQSPHRPGDCFAAFGGSQ